MIRRLLQSLTASLIVAGSASAATYEELSKYAFNTFEMPDGTMVNYRVEGEKSQQTILLVHGGGDSLSVWIRWAAELTKKYRVIRLDMPGHGLSDSVVAEIVDGCAGR